MIHSRQLPQGYSAFGHSSFWGISQGKELTDIIGEQNKQRVWFKKNGKQKTIQQQKKPLAVHSVTVSGSPKEGGGTGV